MTIKSKQNKLAKALQQEEHIPLSILPDNEVLPTGATLKSYQLRVVSNGITAKLEIEAISMLRAKLLVERMFTPLTQCEFIK